jgi:hypothetical protein
MRAKQGSQLVRWVERSDTHQSQFAKLMDFAKGSTHPTRCVQFRSSGVPFHCSAFNPRIDGDAALHSKHGRAIMPVNSFAVQPAQ